MAESPDKDSIFRLESVDKIYHDGVDNQVLYDIDLELYEHDFAVLLGKSGSGKTTLLNIIGLLDTPTAGRVLLDERDVSELDEDERAQLRREYLGFIFQFHHLLPEFNVLDNVLMPCRIRGKKFEDEARERSMEMLEIVGLSDKIHSPVTQLSGGQQQRVATVRAFANNPRLVLADEPTGSLDTRTSQQVMDLMREINRETGTAFLMVTHDDELASYATRVIELEDGRIGRDETRAADRSTTPRLTPDNDS